MPNPTYEKVIQNLQQLGFTFRTAPEDVWVFYHEASGAVILMPTMPVGEAIDPRHFRLVRGTLDRFGFTDPFASDREPLYAG